MKKIVALLSTFVLLSLFMIGCDNVNEKDQPYVVVDSTEKIARLTGSDLPEEDTPNPNQTAENYSVTATDLGVIWDATTDENNPKVMIAFGDTYDDGWNGFGGGGELSGWRSNVLAISSDTDLSDGLEIDYMISDTEDENFAKEIIGSEKDTSGFGDFTAIPTAGISVNNTHYIHYMQIKSWGDPGEWETNFSEIAYSEDEGENWVKSNVTWDAESNFAQAAYVKSDDFVYMFGTPSGRFGNLYIARVPELDVLEKDNYEYWDGNEWISGDESVSHPIVSAPVSELSIQYNSYFDKWIMLYLNEENYSIVMRTSKELTGEWSPETTVVTGDEYPMLYGSYIHPWTNDDNELYFVMSEWEPYNVILLKARLVGSDSIE